MLRLQPLNCFWLLLPILAWNAAFGSRLPQSGFKSDAGVPRSVLAAEQVLRIAVFVWSLLLPLSGQEKQSRAGLALYGVGLLLSSLFVGVRVYHNILVHRLLGVQ